MEKDDQAKREQSRSRDLLERLGLTNKVNLVDLLQNAEPPIPLIWEVEAEHQWSKIVRFTTADGKTLSPRNTFNASQRGKEIQTIIATPLTNGDYTIAFDGKKTNPIPVAADAVVITNALALVGLGDIQAIAGAMNIPGGITLEFGGRYEGKHQVPVVIDSSDLKFGVNPIAPPVVTRIVPPIGNYCIAQQDKGKQFFVLLKQESGNPLKRKPIPTAKLRAFFTKNFKLDVQHGGIEFQLTDKSPPDRQDKIRQKSKD